MKIILTEQQLKSLINVKNHSTGQQQRYDGILIGGLDYRSGDLSLPEQVSVLQNASGLSNIKGFGYNSSDMDISKFITNNPNLPIVLFSAGCHKADVVLRSKGVNIHRVYLVQPYAASSQSMSYFNNLNMPKNHIYVGSSSSSGFGIQGATRCPKGMTHWDSLPKIGGTVISMG